MTAIQISITSDDYQDPDFGWYEFFGSVTNLATDHVEADAEYSDISFSTHFLRAGLTPGAIWYHWVRAIYANGTRKSGFLTLGPVTIQGLGAAQIADNAVTLAKLAQIATGEVLGRKTVGTGNVELLPLGAANGVASLDGGGKVPVSQLPDVVVGALEYQGTWNASTNTPTIPAAAAGNKGWYYKVAVAGTTTISGIAEWAVGDWIVSNGASWDKIDNSESVISVFGRTGVVTATSGDYSFAQISGTASAGQGGTGATTLTAHGVLLGQGVGAVTAVGALADGQIVVGQSAADPLGKTLSGDATLAASGAITVSKTGGVAFGYFATGTNASNLTGTVPAGCLPNPTTSALGGVQAVAAVLHNWVSEISNTGVPALTRPAAADLSDWASGTWTPTDGSGAGLTITTGFAQYKSLGGSLYWVTGNITYPVTADTSAAIIGGLPATVVGSGGNPYGVCNIYSNVGIAMIITFRPGLSTIGFYNATTAAAITNAQMSGKVIVFSGFFFH